MKKRQIGIGIGIVIALTVLVVVIVSGRQKKTEEFPQIAYIENVTWYNTGRICETVPRRMPDGVIETFVSPEIMPDMYNSANFGSEYGSLEYMQLESGEMILHVGEDWLYFEQR